MGSFHLVCTLLSWHTGPHTALFIEFIILSVVFLYFLLHFVTSLSPILHLHVEKGQWEKKRLGQTFALLLSFMFCSVLVFSHGILHEGSLLFLSSLNDLQDWCTCWSLLHCNSLLFESSVVSLLYTYIYISGIDPLI